MPGSKGTPSAPGRRFAEIDEGETTEAVAKAKPEPVKEFAKIVSKKGGPNTPEDAFAELLERKKGVAELFNNW